MVGMSGMYCYDNEEKKKCECCGEFIDDGDYCDSCKQNVQKKLYAFLTGNFTEKEIDVLDEVVNETFYCFMERYKEKENV